MRMRLQKALARAGLASRRRAEEWIAAGRVEVNGQIVRELGVQVDPDSDLIRVDGKLLEAAERAVYMVLYKPPGVVTTASDPQGRQTFHDCLGGVRERVFAVGRLDYDAEGALLVTNDGELANRLMHPRYGVPRTYLAKVKGEPDAAALEKLRGGVRLEDGMARPESVSIHGQATRNTWLHLVLTEGRPHLVKRMCAAIGHPVVRLFRARYAGIGVDGLRPGQWRTLQPEEIERLRRVSAGKATAEEGPAKLPARRHRAPEELSSAPPPALPDEGSERADWSSGGRGQRPQASRPGSGAGRERGFGPRGQRGPRTGSPAEGRGERTWEASPRKPGRPVGRQGFGAPGPRSGQGSEEQRERRWGSSSRTAAPSGRARPQGFGAPRSGGSGEQRERRWGSSPRSSAPSGSPRAQGFGPPPSKPASDGKREGRWGSAPRPSAPPGRPHGPGGRGPRGGPGHGSKTRKKTR